MEESSSSIYYNMFGSMTSGLFARIPCHPLDTCKAKLQIQQSQLKDLSNLALKQTSNINIEDPHIQSKYLPKLRNKLPFNIGKFIAGNGIPHNNNILYKNTFDVLYKTIQREGIVGLYRGLIISVIAGCPASCLYFTSYEITRRKLNKYSYFNKNEYLSDFIGGFMAELISCCLWVPIDVIKERMQIQSIISSKYRYKSTINAIKLMLKYEGFTGLYRAYFATIISFGPFSALYLMLYQQFKGKDNNNTINIIISACTAGAISAIITNPLDMIKLRLQVQRGGIISFGYKNIFDGIYKLIKYEGFISLFHGSGARVAFWVPNLAFNLTLYETFTQFYKENF